MIWLIVLIIGVNTSLMTVKSSDNLYLDAYTLKLYDDTTAFIGVGIYNSMSDYTMIYLFKLVNGSIDLANYLGGLYGHCTSLDIAFLGDSVFTVVSGDSGYIYAVITDRNLNQLGILPFTGEFSPKIYSAKIMVVSKGEYINGYAVYSFRGSGGRNTLVISRKQLSPGNAEAQIRWEMSYEPYVVDLDYSIGLDTFFIYVSREMTDPNDPSNSKGVVNVFTDAITTGQFSTRMEYERYPFGLEESVKYMTFAADSCHTIAVAHREDDSRYFISYNSNFGRGQWDCSIVLDTFRNDYFLTSYFLGDTSFFPMMWGMYNGSIYIEKFKIPRNQTQGAWETMWEITENPTYITFPFARSFHSARMSLYRKRLEYSPSLASHMAIWHQDFYHYTPTWPYIPVLDSTSLWIDYAFTPRVEERWEKVRLYWDVKTKTLRLVGGFGNKDYRVEVYDILGVRKLASQIPLDGTMPLTLLRSGVYFVILKGRGNEVYRCKIVYQN